jgi:hypothetical protein
MKSLTEMTAKPGTKTPRLTLEEATELLARTKVRLARLRQQVGEAEQLIEVLKEKLDRDSRADA